MTNAEIIQATLEAIVEEWNKEIDALGYTASGQTAKSWRIETSGAQGRDERGRFTAKETTGSLFGNWDAFNTIVEERYGDNGKGRKPGGPPKFQAILEWIQAKGLQGRDKKGRFITQEQFADLVRWSIAKKGTQLFRGLRQGVDMKGIVERHRKIMMEKLTEDWVDILKTEGIEKGMQPQNT